jgi:hypothetical protein
MALEMQPIDWRQQPNSRERIMFFAALVGCCLAFFRACWSPGHDSIVEIQERIDKVQQEQKVAAQLGASKVPSATPTPVMRGVLENVGSIKDAQMAIDTIAQPLLLKGVSLTSMRASEIEREGRVVRQKVDLILVGSFYAVAEYLEAAEKLPSPLVIEDFSIATKDDRSGRVTATIKGSFYGMDK